MSAQRGKISAVRPVDDEHVVLAVEGGGAYRRRPCGGCPWRIDQTGSFPAEAFRVSARTAVDMAGRAFGCHEAGADRPATCAGFLLRGAEHNFAVRSRIARGLIHPNRISDGGHRLHAGYVAMAVANGVPADDPALRGCRLSPWEEGR